MFNLLFVKLTCEVVPLLLLLLPIFDIYFLIILMQKTNNFSIRTEKLISLNLMFDWTYHRNLIERLYFISEQFTKLGWFFFNLQSDGLLYFLLITKWNQFDHKRPYLWEHTLILVSWIVFSFFLRLYPIRTCIYHCSQNKHRMPNLCKIVW